MHFKYRPINAYQPYLAPAHPTQLYFSSIHPGKVLLYKFQDSTVQGVPLKIVPFSMRGKILNITQIENSFWHLLDKNAHCFNKNCMHFCPIGAKMNFQYE